MCSLRRTAHYIRASWLREAAAPYSVGLQPLLRVLQPLQRGVAAPTKWCCSPYYVGLQPLLRGVAAWGRRRAARRRAAAADAAPRAGGPPGPPRAARRPAPRS